MAISSLEGQIKDLIFVFCLTIILRIFEKNTGLKIYRLLKLAKNTVYIFGIDI